MIDLSKRFLAVIITEAKNILLRNLYERAEEKVGIELFFFFFFLCLFLVTCPFVCACTSSFSFAIFFLQLRPKRAASENLMPEHGFKQPRASS